MSRYVINGVGIHSTFDMGQEEAFAYLKYALAKHPNAVLVELSIAEDDEEYVDIKAYDKPKPFVRIRRVTGYLSETQLWGNGKRAELADRTTHETD